MGVVISRFYPEDTGRTDDPDPVTGFTSHERYLVKSTWAILKKDPTTNGTKIFMSLFKKEPTYLQLFPFKDVAYDDLPNNKRFQAHCNSLMYGFSSIIDNIDDPDMLIELLKKQGVAHKPRGVPPEAYDVLKVVLMEIFKESFTKDAVEAWSKTLDVALSVIVKAGDYN